MLHDIVEARPLDGHRVFLRFDDGASGTIDLNMVIRFDGVFEALRDTDYFARMKVDSEFGTVVWPNGADLCPDMLHAKLDDPALPGTPDATGTPCCR